MFPKSSGGLFCSKEEEADWHSTGPHYTQGSYRSGKTGKTVAMPPKIGGGVLPNGYAPEIRGRNFRQKLSSRISGSSFFTNNL